MIRAAVLTVVLALALAGSAHAAAPRLKLSLRSVDATKILQRKALSVNVAVRRRGRVRVSAGRLARARTLRFKRRGHKTVRLRLTARGRRTIGRCFLRTRITVRAGKRRTRRLLRLPHVCSSLNGDEIFGPGVPPSTPPLPEPAGFATPAGCDSLDQAVCLQPWPNDYFTVADASTPTGRRLSLQSAAMPKNIAGKPVEAADYNRSDGFSPGAAIHTKSPGLDNQAAFDRTGLVPETDMAKSFEPGQPAVVIDADTGERHLIWAELDSQATANADRNLFIRPGKNFTEGHRYIVALRNLRRADGSAIEPARAFKVYRDRIVTTSPVVEARRAHMEDLFARLGQAGIGRGDLYLAWDFTVGSAQRIAGRLLGMRNAAFAELGDTNLSDRVAQGSAPTNVPGACQPSDANDHPPDLELTRVCGTFTVPCFLDQPGCPTGSRFAFAGATSNDPVRIPHNTMAANYDCIIRTDATSASKARVVLYGHGLLGDASEVDLAPQRAMVKRFNYAYCATDWKGMAMEDVPNVGTILNDLSRFPTLTDRMQQGLLNFLYLGRLLRKGFPNETGLAGRIDSSALFYDGNSQGGIYGGTLTAVAPDFQRSVLGVPGMNYSTLLQRSTDFSQYATVLYTSYPNEIERPLLFSLLQQLWDRSDPNGYAQHMTTSPYPGTPPHTVLMQSAVGDHQVANVAADVEARTIGARIRATPVDPGRSRDVQPFYAIARTGFATNGSVYEPWDAGAGFNALAPNGNTPPVNSASNQDPHGVPRRTPAAQDQKAGHLRPGGSIADHCAGHACHGVP
ncbi:MAG: hypothetical protein ABI611_21025 [Solirubrobacteraceae bacterium]